MVKSSPLFRASRQRSVRRPVPEAIHPHLPSCGHRGSRGLHLVRDQAHRGSSGSRRKLPPIRRRVQADGRVDRFESKSVHSRCLPRVRHTGPGFHRGKIQPVSRKPNWIPCQARNDGPEQKTIPCGLPRVRHTGPGFHRGKIPPISRKPNWIPPGLQTAGAGEVKRGVTDWEFSLAFFLVRAASLSAQVERLHATRSSFAARSACSRAPDGSAQQGE